MRIRHKLGLACAAALSFASLPAQAAIQMTGTTYSPPALEGTINLTAPPTQFYGPVGRFDSTWDNVAPPSDPFQLYTWCVDILHSFQSYRPYDVLGLASLTGDVTKQAHLAGLLAYANGEIASFGLLADQSKAAAAIGIAIWEVVYESGAYDAGAGDFFVGNFDFTPALIAQANSYLSNVSGGSWTGDVSRVRYLRAQDRSIDGSQDQIYYSDGVPEPSTWALLLVGFALIGAAMRRRNAGALAAA